MPTGTATSFLTPNYSGVLFNKGNTNAPFSAMIGMNGTKTTNHVEFTTGQNFTTNGGKSPNISENKSLTAPDPTYITREQKTNVTQIYQKSLAISYAKMSNMGTLSGLNVAGQQANPTTEKDFQVFGIMQELQQDIEFTFINGKFSKATNDDGVNSTRGMDEAITSNHYDIGGRELSLWDLTEMLAEMKDVQHAPTVGLVLWCKAAQKLQLCVEAEVAGYTIMPPSRNTAGLNITTIITPFGNVDIYLGEYIPDGTCYLFNFGVIHPVEQPVPGKGNFFKESLAKVGAGDKEQIYGQLGLDHGPEWYHAKFTNIDSSYKRPQRGTSVFVENTVGTTSEKAVIDSVELTTSPVVGTATTALEIDYVGSPASPTLAYQWEIGNIGVGIFNPISGATNATYTPLSADEDKFIRCKVTVSGTAEGTATSNSKKVKV